MIQAPQKETTSPCKGLFNLATRAVIRSSFLKLEKFKLEIGCTFLPARGTALPWLWRVPVGGALEPRPGCL